MVVPLIYLINHDGSALESICGRATPEEIRAKLSSVESLVKGDGASPAPSTSSTAVKPENSSTTTKEEGKSSDGAEVNDSVDGAKDSTEVEARRSAAQEQLMEIRRRKEKEEKEKEKEKEKERREVGQRMTELKRFQREQELKELREEIAKKRKEERDTRERIRRQIEEDRRERMSRNAPASSSSSSPAAAAQSSPAQMTTSSGAADGDTRLQFRLPDGSNVVHVFRSNAPLREAFDFISAELNGRLGAFRISSLYPRRLFGADDMDSSLLDLALSPSAALVVMPDARSVDGGSRSSAATSVGGGALAKLVLAPVMILWGILCSVFAALTALLRRPAPAAGAATASRSEGARNAQRERRLGGINRLSDLPRDDDDVNTWNGNSTQQKWHVGVLCDFIFIFALRCFPQ